MKTTWLLSSLALLACTESIPVEDGRDDPFVLAGADGKADEVGIVITPDEYQAILGFVRKAGTDRLEEAGVSARAAAAIEAAKWGPDGRWSTADDVDIRSLAQLDAIPWVGPATLERLLARVQEPDLADSFVDTGWRILSGTNEATYIDTRSSGLSFGATFVANQAGELATFFQHGDRDFAIAIDGHVVELPEDPLRHEETTLNAAFDAAGGLHVFYGTSRLNGTAQAHLVYRDGEWSESRPVAGSNLVIAGDSHGRIVGVAWSRNDAKLVEIDEDTVTYTPFPETGGYPAQIVDTNPLAINVDGDDVVITWVHDPCRQCANTTRTINLVRHTQAGFSSIATTPVPTRWLSDWWLKTVAVSGGDSPVVLLSDGLGLFYAREEAGALVAREQPVHRGGADYLGGGALTTDAQGNVHACLYSDFIDNLRHLSIDSQGTARFSTILDDEQTPMDACSVRTTPDGSLRIAYVARYGVVEAARD